MCCFTCYNAPFSFTLCTACFCFVFCNIVYNLLQLHCTTFTGPMLTNCYNRFIQTTLSYFNLISLYCVPSGAKNRYFLWLFFNVLFKKLLLALLFILLTVFGRKIFYFYKKTEKEISIVAFSIIRLSYIRHVLLFLGNIAHNVLQLRRAAFTMMTICYNCFIYTLSHFNLIRLYFVYRLVHIWYFFSVLCINTYGFIFNLLLWKYFSCIRLFY